MCVVGVVSERAAAPTTPFVFFGIVSRACREEGVHAQT